MTTTSNYDTTVSTQVGLEVKSWEQFHARLGNLPSVPMPMFATETNILRNYVIRAYNRKELDGKFYLSLNKQLDTLAENKRKGL